MDLDIGRSPVARVTVASAIRVRPATLADAEPLSRLASELGYDVTAPEIKTHLVGLPLADELLVASLGDRLVGWIQLSVSESLVHHTHVQIVGLVVSRLWRGKGIGRRLMRDAEMWARARGATTILLRATNQREEARRFYQALGYRELGTQKVFVRELE